MRKFRPRKDLFDIMGKTNEHKRDRGEIILMILFLAKTKSASDIAKEMSIRKGYVYEILKKNGVPFIPSNYWWTDEEREFLKNNYHLPIEELEIKLGKTAKAILKYARVELGLLRPRKDGGRHKKFSIIEEEEGQRIRELIKEYSPTEVGRILGRGGTTIVRYCTTHGIPMPHKRLSFKDFTDEKLLEMLKEYADELGRTPMTLDIQDNKKFPSIDIYYDRFGKYSTACIKAGLVPNGGAFGTSCLSKNDDWCFSVSEQYITNYFIDNNIPYIKEVPYSYVIGNNRTNSLIMDWYIYDKYAVEYFGMEKMEAYNTRTKNKIRLCKNYKIPLIKLYPNDLADLDKIFNNIK